MPAGGGVEILCACVKEAYRSFAPITRELRAHDCSKEVAQRIDCRLYRLNCAAEVFTEAETPHKPEG